jgi:hypothetical protein
LGKSNCTISCLISIIFGAAYNNSLNHGTAICLNKGYTNGNQVRKNEIDVTNKNDINKSIMEVTVPQKYKVQ